LQRDFLSRQSIRNPSLFDIANSYAAASRGRRGGDFMSQRDGTGSQ